MATIRKRNNSYQIRVSCGYNSNDEQIVKTKTWKPEPGMTAKQIEKELQRQAVLFEEQCQTGQFLDGNITLSEFAERWFKDYAQTQLKIKTVSEYSALMERINNEIGHIKLAKLQPHHLLEFYNKLSAPGMRKDTKYAPPENFAELLKDSGMTLKALSEVAGVAEDTVRKCKKGCNISPTTAEKISKALNIKGLFKAVNIDKTLSEITVSEYHRLLSSMLTTAVHWQVIPSNPCNRVKPPKVARKEAQVLDEKQAAELISCLQNESIQFRTAIMLLLYTGLRRGELCGLEWSDVDLEHGILKISKAVLYLPEIGIYEDSTKNKSSERIINIPSDMCMMLKEHRTEQLKQQLIHGDLWQNSGKIFTSTNGGVINPDTLSTQFSKFIKRNSLPDAHLHTLRHTSATLLIAGGVDVATVSKRLGHADKTTTLNIYTHAIRSADEAAAEKLNQILNPTQLYKAN